MLFRATVVLIGALGLAGTAMAGKAPAGADGAKPADKAKPLAEPPAALVKVMGDAGQALIKDQIRGIYVVVQVGDRYRNFTVRSISPKRIVMTSLATPSVHFVLPLAGTTTTKKPPATKKPASNGLMNPYAKSKAGSKTRVATTAPVNPYVPASKPAPSPAHKPAPTPKKTAKKTPKNPYASTPMPKPTVFEPPIPKPPGAKKPTAPAATRPAPEKATKTATPGPATPKPTTTRRSALSEQRRIHKADFDKALSDFDALSKEALLRKQADGILIAGLARGGFFHRIGLRAGDKVLSVAGKPIRSVSDAATVYASLMTASRFSVVLLRSNQRVTIQYTLVK